MSVVLTFLGDMHACTYEYVCTHACIHSTHTHVHTCTCTRTHTYTHTACMSTHSHACTHTHACMHTHACTHACTHTHTHTHTHTQRLIRMNDSIIHIKCMCVCVWRGGGRIAVLAIFKNWVADMCVRQPFFGPRGDLRQICQAPGRGHEQRAEGWRWP